MFVVCGVTLDDSSAIALMRARDLARTLRLGLLLVHVCEARPTLEPAERDQLVERVREWAFAATGLVVPPETVHVSCGDVTSSLARLSRRADTALLVVGMGNRTYDLVARTTRPVLVAAAPTGECVLIVGSDCSGRLPVVRSAATLGFRLGALVVAVHSFLEEPRARFPRQLAPVIAAHRRFRLQQVRGVDEAIVTHDEDPSEVILRCAAARHADVIAVGTRMNRSRSIPRAILERARCSVLVVPVD